MQSLPIVVILVMAVALLPDRLPSAGWVWEGLNGLGLAALMLMVSLAWEAQTPARPLALRVHQSLAIVATTLVVLHAVGFLLVDPVLFEHLKPSAPASMLSAWMGLLFLVFLCFGSFPSWRRRIWSGFDSFRRWHLALSISIVSLMLWHVIGTASVFGSSWKMTALLGLVAGTSVLAVLLRRGGITPPLAVVSVASGHVVRRAVVVALMAVVGSFAYGWIKQP